MANDSAKLAATVEQLRSKIPVEDQAALDSRMQALLNDPDADENDVAAILLREFGARQ